MIKNFKNFVNEAELNENPAIAAAVAPVVADMAAKKLAKKENLNPAEMGQLINECANMFEADDDDTHTHEGYMNEVKSEMDSVVKNSLAAKSPKTAAFAAQPEA